MIISQLYEIAAEIRSINSQNDNQGIIRGKINKYNMKRCSKRLFNRIHSLASEHISNEEIEDYSRVLRMFYQSSMRESTYVDTEYGPVLVDFSNAEYNIMEFALKADGEVISIKYNDGELSHSRTSNGDPERQPLPANNAYINKIVAAAICNSMHTICELMIINGGTM